MSTWHLPAILHDWTPKTITGEEDYPYVHVYEICLQHTDTHTCSHTPIEFSINLEAKTMCCPATLQSLRGEMGCQWPDRFVVVSMLSDTNQTKLLQPISVFFLASFSIFFPSYFKYVCGKEHELENLDFLRLFPGGTKSVCCNLYVL